MGKNKKSVTGRTLYYFWRATMRYKWSALGGLVTTPIVIFFRNILTPYLLAEMIGIISNGTSGDDFFPKMWPLAIAVVVAEVLRNFLFGPIRLWCIWKMEIKTMYDLSCQAFDVIAAQSMQFHADNFSGSLVSQVNRFTSAYEKLMDEFFFNVFPVILDIVMVLIVLVPRVPVFAIGMVIFIIFFMVISKVWFKKMAPIHEKEVELSNKCTGQLSDSIANIVSVKSYAREKYEGQRYARFQKDWFKATSGILMQTMKRDYFFDFVGIGMSVLVLALMLYGQNWFGLSITTLILVVNYSRNVLSDLWDVHSIFKSLNRIFGDAKEMTVILDMKDDVVDAPDAKPLKVGVTAKVDFDKISFKHPGAKQAIFKDFSLDIKLGERVGLVGVSGSGKTTLTKLLLRFADVYEGKITIDGQDIREVTQESLRKAIAYVPQESALFHRSVFENIAYGRPGATDEEVFEAARLAHADEFIAELPEGYDTMVGERGVKLSGGQRQRIAIARAILKDAPILVLDEATSALDSESEAAIQEALSNLMEGRTSIVVAHRLSTIAGLDKIVVLRDGVIVEQGTHRELLAAGGEYAKLWSRQSGAFLE